MRSAAIFILLLTAVALSCNTGNEPPENLIGEDKYINLLIELQLLKNYQAQSAIDSALVDSLLNEVFNKYGVTSKQFKKSHRYYQNNIEKQSDRIDRAIDRLRKDRIRKPDSTSNPNIELSKSETLLFKIF